MAAIFQVSCNVRRYWQAGPLRMAAVNADDALARNRWYTRRERAWAETVGRRSCRNSVVVVACRRHRETSSRGGLRLMSTPATRPSRCHFDVG
ncbi:hypothetical protein LSAT2_006562 [Lamellibrachia satsuma]|nr:hypothetical protein LSAT2_006562 [Lamellibrachia satsuma]